MLRRFLIAVLLLLPIFFFSLEAQNSYYVQFTDKANSPYSLSQPGDYLSARALARRTLQNIAIDSTDLPVNPHYLDSLSNRQAQVLYASRWMNGAIINVPSSFDLNTITSLPFVSLVECTFNNQIFKHPRVEKIPSPSDTVHFGSSLNQIAMLGGHHLHNMGCRGAGKWIAVLDNGFLGVNHLSAFDSIRSRILYVHNFVHDSTDVYTEGTHGTMVLSTIGANIPNQYIGMAPDASFLLFKTEDTFSESLRECDNWIVAAEKADSLGADIITSSLGYTQFDDQTTNFTYSTLDGRSTRISRAATMAARKGMIVLTAAGNEGQSSWRYISAPADADSIITVGSVNANSKHSSFSSIGPTADNRIKPTLCAQGQATAVVTANGTVSISNGTSFATPIMAGLVACLWEAFPTMGNMELIDYLIESAHMYNNPTPQMGYGIPDGWFVYNDVVTTLHTEENSSRNHIIYQTPDNSLFVSNPKGLKFAAFLFDLQGNQLKASRDVSQLKWNLNYPKGIYILKITDKSGTYTQKIIIK